uniref:Transporter n=3 Tax=Lygus hesperus TaxID=30085 RepID=A0A0A9YIP2_LYGHE
MEEGEDTALKKEEVTSSLAHYNLDDGYGSSISSPHSFVQAQYCGPGKKGKKDYSSLALEDDADRRSLEMRLIDGVLTSQVVCPDEDEELPVRETWGRNADFLLSIIGFAVDLANVWRFPYLCYKNGGGAFLVPYTLMLVFGAVPLFYMELVLGQYNKLGPISVWKICPIFKGAGVCAVVVAFFVSFYYNVIIAWALYFLAESLVPQLPWMFCNNTWNSLDCRANSWVTFNATADGSMNITRRGEETPAAEYFNRGVLELDKSEGLHDLGFPKWQLVICVFIVYVMLYLSLFKGVKSTGKVVWLTATMPYVVLAILLVRGLMLPGALSGIKYYLQPEMSKLKETGVWVDAAVQIFFSVGAGFGVHLSYASYNNFNNNCFNDCIITSCVNSFTSFFSGFVIFTYLGFMSHKQGIPIDEVAAEGPGLVFQVYPEAVATLPGSHFWSVLFFFMLIMLGLDSGMGGLECIITGVIDEYGGYLRRTKYHKYTREIFTAVLVGTSFSVALLNVTPGGMYFFHLMDTYAGGLSLLCSALFEAIAVAWFYGMERFCEDVHEMLGWRPGIIWRILWKFVSPLLLSSVILASLFDSDVLSYKEYIYPGWAVGVGRAIGLTSFLMIPGLAIFQLVRTPGTLREKFAIGISPVDEHAEIRATGEASRLKLRHWLYV